MGSTFSKGSEQSGQSAGISTNQAGTSQALADSALRVLMPSMDQFATFIGGGPLPQAFTGNLSTQEQELASAKDAIMGTGSRGGQLNTQLANLPLQRLMMRDQLRGQVFNTALQTALPGMSIGLGGETSAANNLDSLGAQQIQQNQAFQQGLGQLAGTLAKSFA